MTVEEFCYEYEQVIAGKRMTYSPEIFNDKGKKEQEKTALSFIKVILEKYLHWTPDESYHYLSEKVIEEMKIKPLLRYIHFPFEFNIQTDCWMIVAKIYPEKYPIDIVELTKEIYQKVLDGELCRYPKCFFEGRDGQMRALFCLKYALNTYKTFSGPEELYKFFSEEGKEFLKEYKLWDAFLMNYDTEIEYLHDIFDEDRKEKYQKYFDKYNAGKTEEKEEN